MSCFKTLLLAIEHWYLGELMVFPPMGSIMLERFAVIKERLTEELRAERKVMKLKDPFPK